MPAIRGVLFCPANSAQVAICFNKFQFSSGGFNSLVTICCGPRSPEDRVGVSVGGRMPCKLRHLGVTSRAARATERHIAPALTTSPFGISLRSRIIMTIALSGVVRCAAAPPVAGAFWPALSGADVRDLSSIANSTWRAIRVRRHPGRSPFTYERFGGQQGAAREASALSLGQSAARPRRGQGCAPCGSCRGSSATHQLVCDDRFSHRSSGK